ncbi:hypothetical protein QOL99_00300 [Deinococcus sp. MIMF12]|uniref:Uncharacterized protein n=1 Tax=Deinococcus rhizophilus TaxID=3049544 RepID=A0ABT7JFZ4_9DEIO|nr:hypothetical protein [Deinococcus rhizophilus]MDL2342589.1 hypothetical protein [Deinococcus rhizophilus]
MKALSVSVPWPTAIERHGKRTENRPRWARHPHLIAQARRMVGQDLAIHSSGTYDRDGAEYIERLTGVLYRRQDVPSKAVTSVVTVTGLLLPGDPCPPGQERWYFGSLALVLDNVRVLPNPVAVSGSLGFWALTGDVLADVNTQLEALSHLRSA